MTERIVYLDNAATSYPKPESVTRAQTNFMMKCGSAGRGAHKLALDASRVVFESRLSLAAYLGIDRAERLIFSPGCTYSLNYALKGLGLKRGDLVIVSAMEHNALMRPLTRMKETLGIEIEALPYSPGNIISPADLQAALKRRKPALCAFMQASNLTGEILDTDAVVSLLGSTGIPLIIDGAQSAGHNYGKVPRYENVLWTSSGHKGLLGPQGVGLLYVGEAVDLESIIEGGTGSSSQELRMPGGYPDHLECGTLPGPAIAGLGEGVRFLSQPEAIDNSENGERLAQVFAGWLRNSDGFETFGFPRKFGAGIVSFRSVRLSCDILAQRLSEEYGIYMRAGLHCAPAAHKALGTLEGGLVRASFGRFNTESELDFLTESLLKIHG